MFSEFFSFNLIFYINLTISLINLKLCLLYLFMFQNSCIYIGCLHINICNCCVNGRIIWFNIKIYQDHRIIQSLIPILNLVNSVKNHQFEKLQKYLYFVS